MERSRTRAEAEARQQEERRQQERRKHIIVLMLHHLYEHGYVNSVETLQTEAGVSLSDILPADNVDLGVIVRDFEAYFEIRFDRKPKLVRKAMGQGLDVGAAAQRSQRSHRPAAATTSARHHGGRVH